jgi:hypothetical protein
MASTFSPLGVELMATGENAGTWGAKTNTNLQLVEQILGGFTQQSIAGGAGTTALTITDNGTGDTAGHRMIEFTGTISGNRIVTIPNDVQTFYILIGGRMASEVFKVSLNAGVSNSEVVLINGVSGHTYVIMSIVITETAGADETVDVFIDDDGGGTDFEVLSDQAVGANETFVFNDRLVIEDTDHLCAQLASAGNVDITVTYLDQTR